jgi:hypothetical protein
VCCVVDKNENKNVLDKCGRYYREERRAEDLRNTPLATLRSSSVSQCIIFDIADRAFIEVRIIRMTTLHNNENLMNEQAAVVNFTNAITVRAGKYRLKVSQRKKYKERLVQLVAAL